MNVGKIYWKDDLVTLNSFVEIFVEDDDMNKKDYPNFADKFTIEVWSDSSPEHFELEVLETGIFTGKFKGRIYVTDSESAGKKLFAKPGDVIYALYVDTTIPQTKSSSDILAAAIVKISGTDMSEYLNKLETLSGKQQTLIPEWIKNNAGWWAEDSISESDFIQGIQYLIKENILSIPDIAEVDSQLELKDEKRAMGLEREMNVPDWIKNNAGWWAEGTITENEFINAIQYLIKVGIISIESETQIETILPSDDSKLSPLEVELKACQEIKKSYERLNCEKEVKWKMTLQWYKQNAEFYEVGPVTFYYPGLQTAGNSFEISSLGQALLSVRMLAENTGSSENVAMFCTSPSVCNYEVWNGIKAFKYSSQDFVSGQIVLKPGEAKEFNLFFGPNIGYGGTEFEYDPSKDYYFRISEPWGSLQIPLNLK